jgi:hypothetical protein
MAKIAERHSVAITEAVNELADLGLVEKATAEVRLAGSSPLFKVYLINEHDLFFGYYPVMEHTVTIAKKRVPTFDPMGKDTVLFHHTADADPESTGSQYIAETAKWFNSAWNTIARDASHE